MCPLLIVCQIMGIILAASRSLNDSWMCFIVCLNRRKQLFLDIEFTTIIIILRLGYCSVLYMKVFTDCIGVLNCLKWVTISDIMGGSCWGQSKSILYNFHCSPVYFQVLFNELAYNSPVIFHLGCVRDQLTLSLRDQYQKFL